MQEHYGLNARAFGEQDRVRQPTSVEIDQGYLPGEKLVERIRRVRWTDGTECLFQTVKLGSGLERVEVEEEGADHQCRTMWRLTKGRRILRRRYSIRYSDDVLWEVDEFLDRRLVVAEIELSLHARDLA